MTGNDLIQIRKSLGLTQTQLGRVLNVTERTIRRWERGKWKIPQDVRSQVAKMHRRGLKG